MPSVSPRTQTNNYMDSINPDASNAEQNIDAIVPFPNPSNFTFLPELYLVISRLSILRSSVLATNGAIGSGSTNVNPLTTTISHESRISEASGASQKSAEAIEVKDLPAYVYTIRQALTRAKEIVRGLPDIQRNNEEQESEIHDLEMKIRALNHRLEELGAIAGQGRLQLAHNKMEEQDSGMTGIEK